MASPETPARQFVDIVDTVFLDNVSRTFDEIHSSFSGKHIVLPGGLIFYKGKSFDRFDSDPWGPATINNQVRKIHASTAAFGNDASGLEIGVGAAKPDKIIRVLDHEIGKGTPAAHLGKFTTFRELAPEESEELIGWLNSRYKHPDALSNIQSFDNDEQARALEVKKTVASLNSRVKAASNIAPRPRREEIARMPSVGMGWRFSRYRPLPKRRPRST